MSLRKNLFSAFKRSNLHNLLLVALCLIVFASHTFYVLLTGQYPTWDEVHYVGYVSQFYEIFTNPSLNVLSDFYEVLNERQPLYSLLVTIPTLLSGTQELYRITLLANGFFFIGTIIGIYFLSREYFGKTASLLASFSFATYGFPLFYLHFAYTETSATMWVVLSILFLVKTNLFQNRNYVLYFSLSFAAAILTRWSAPVFIAGPMLIVFVSTAWKFYKSKKKRKANVFLLKNFLIFIAIGIFIPFAIYYLQVWDDFMKYLHSGSSNAAEWMRTIHYMPEGIENPYSVRSIMFYFNIISQQTIVPFALFGIGVIFSLIKFKRYALLLSAFIIPYFFFTFITVFKDDRFIVPLYPAIAIISAVAFEQLFFRWRILKWLSILTIVSIGALNFLAASWAIGPMGKQGLKDVVLPEFIHHPRRVYLTPMVWPPRPKANGEKLIESLSAIQDDDFRGKKAIFFHAYILDQAEGQMAKKAIYENRRLNSVYASQRKRISEIKPNDYVTLLQYLKESDVLIVKSTLPYEKGKEPENKDLIDYFYKTILQGRLPRAFVKMNEIFIPQDKTYFVIYKKSKPITEEEWELFESNFPTIQQ